MSTAWPSVAELHRRRPCQSIRSACRRRRRHHSRQEQERATISIPHRRRDQATQTSPTPGGGHCARSCTKRRPKRSRRRSGAGPAAIPRQSSSPPYSTTTYSCSRPLPALSPFLPVITFRGPIVWVGPVGRRRHRRPVGLRAHDPYACTTLGPLGRVDDRNPVRVRLPTSTDYGLSLLISRDRDELGPPRPAQERCGSRLSRLVATVLAKASTIMIEDHRLVVGDPTTRRLGIACAVGIIRSTTTFALMHSSPRRWFCSFTRCLAGGPSDRAHSRSAEGRSL